jgi:hypothetical protein
MAKKKGSKGGKKKSSQKKSSGNSKGSGLFAKIAARAKAIQKQQPSIAWRQAQSKAWDEYRKSK